MSLGYLYELLSTCELCTNKTYVRYNDTIIRVAEDTRGTRYIAIYDNDRYIAIGKDAQCTATKSRAYSSILYTYDIQYAIQMCELYIRIIDSQFYVTNNTSNNAIWGLLEK